MGGLGDGEGYSIMVIGKRYSMDPVGQAMRQQPQCQHWDG